MGAEGCIFLYSGSARLVSFEIKLISKEVSRTEPEYMNKQPPPNSVLATALRILLNPEQCIWGRLFEGLLVKFKSHSHLSCERLNLNLKH